MKETIITHKKVEVVITAGALKGEIGIVEEIDENLMCQLVILDGMVHPITNEWLTIVK